MMILWLSMHTTTMEGTGITNFCLISSILSQDTDFFRYSYPFVVFDKFTVEEGNPQPNNPHHIGKLFLQVVDVAVSHAQHRKLRHKLPATVPVMPYLNKEEGFLAGTPSPLTRDMGNPHKKVKILRQALYSILGYEQIEETYPEWDESSDTVVWHKETGRKQAENIHTTSAC